MKYFISYRHTGAEEPRLGTLQNAIKEAFDARSGDEFYSTYFDVKQSEDDKDWASVVMDVLGFIDSFDVILVILDSEIKSEGMLIEIGYCLAKGKEIIVAINSQVTNTYFQDLASKKFEYSSIEELKQKLISL